MHVMRAKAAALLAASMAAVSMPDAVRADDTVRACIAASTDGQTLRQQGKLLAAREAMIACARDACPPIVRSHCARWLSEVEAAIPSVVVRAENAQGEDAVGARLSVDGRPAELDGKPLRLDPGPHTLVVENDRGERKEERVLLVEGDAARRVTLRLAAPPPARVDAGASGPAREANAGSPSARGVPVGAWIVGAAGVAALGAGTYFAIAAGDQLHHLNETCSPHCNSAETQTGRTDALLSYVSLGVGGAAMAGALVWGLLFPARPVTAAWAPRLEVVPRRGGALGSLGTTF